MSVFQINVQMWTPLVDILLGIDALFYLNLSIFQYNVQIYLKFDDFFPRIGRYFGWK